MAGRILQFSRKFSNTAKLRASLSEPLQESETSTHHLAQLQLWRKTFFFVCCPTLLLGYISTYFEEEHQRPEFIKYPHLRIRNKKYPWRDGVKTLFHNPRTNALPDGYEVLDEHH